MKILIDEEVVKQALASIEALEIAHGDVDASVKNKLRSALQTDKVEPVTFNEWWMDQDFDPVDGFPAALAAWEFRNKHAAPTPPTNTDELREAARAVVECDESADKFAVKIDRLRKAL